MLLLSWYVKWSPLLSRLGLKSKMKIKKEKGYFQLQDFSINLLNLSFTKCIQFIGKVSVTYFSVTLVDLTVFHRLTALTFGKLYFRSFFSECVVRLCDKPYNTRMNLCNPFLFPLVKSKLHCLLAPSDVSKYPFTHSQSFFCSYNGSFCTPTTSAANIWLKKSSKFFILGLNLI